MRWYIADLMTGKPLDKNGDFADTKDSVALFDNLSRLNKHCAENSIQNFDVSRETKLASLPFNLSKVLMTSVDNEYSL
jgi:hypothetical protein